MQPTKTKKKNHGSMNYLADEASVAAPRSDALFVENGNNAHPTLYQSQDVGVVREVHVTPGDTFLFVFHL